MNMDDRQREYNARMSGLLPEARNYILAHNEGLQKAIDWLKHEEGEDWMASAKLAFYSARKAFEKMLIKSLDTD